MTPEKNKILLEKYPKIFGENFYFECGDGWIDLISCLCEQIQHHLDWKYKNLPQEEKDAIQVVATQVKEKYGGLRFYHIGGDEHSSGMISLAESMSYLICEGCGNKGKCYPNGWHRTHCEPCEKEYQEKRNPKFVEE